MGPKKGKDTLDENSWRTYIETTPLNQENWTVKVVLFEAAGSDQDRIYLNKFEIFAAEEKRFVIKNICKTETIFMVNQLGGEKKVKDDNLRVFEEGQAYLKDKKDIPPDILALIIKHLILKMKDEYLFIKRQRLEVREGMRRESATMVNTAEVRGTVNVKPPEPVEVPPSPKSKGKKGESEPPPLPEPDEGKKYNTQLRVRGEEWRDKVYVDDYPTDGPNIYVALTGFVEPFLLGCLVKIGIPLTAVVQIRIDPGTTKVPSTLFRATKRGQSQTEILTEKSQKFWEDLQSLRIQKETVDDFKNTAFIVFSPPYWDADSLSGDPDKIYDELCYLMYDIQDLTRQHNHYLKNMDIIHIAEIETETVSLCNKHYHKLTDYLPLECVTIYTILDNILQTACKNLEDDLKSSTSSLSTAVTTNAPHNNTTESKVAQAEKLVKEVFNTLCKTDSLKKSYRITYGEEYESHKDPIVINYGDFAKNNTFHLGNINLSNIVWNSLFRMPINNLWKNQSRPTSELEAKVNFHINVLLSCFDREDVETAELNRLIHILACRKLYNNRSSLKKSHLGSSTISEFKKVYLKRSVLAEPLTKCRGSFHEFGGLSPSFPSMTKSENVSNTSHGADPEVQRIKYLFDCPDISELISAAEIANEMPINHMIDDFDFFEDFTDISALQIMLDAFNKFNCVDYKYCEVTDCIVLMFFNSHDTDGIAREEWRCHLPTPLCLQDFFDFVLEEHYGWIQKEENEYEEQIFMKTQSECKIYISPLDYTTCVDDTDVAVDLLMEGSLKYQELEQIEDSTPEDTYMKTPASKKTTISAASTDAETKSPKKSKGAASSPKHIRQSLMTCVSPEEVKKPFSGYDLGDRRVEVFGKDAIYFSKDGTKVTSMYTLIIPINLEYIVLNILPGLSYNEFWFHKALGEDIKPNIIDTCESFRINSKDQVMINVVKQTYQIPLPLVITMPRSKEGISASSKLNNLIYHETRSFHSLFVTWPNGLITESVHENNSHVLSHIKQYYVTSRPHLGEDMRCISLNGEVIVFKSSGEIEILNSDGSYIKINQCEKRIIVSDVIEEPSEASSDKSKKSKGKDKPKDKLSKTSSKSKHGIRDDDKINDEKPIEYELLISEFESIDTNGLRQKWVDNIPYYIEKLLIRTATDYCLGEIFSRRMDGTSILLNKDGIQVVTFPDKTRIITYYVIEDEIIYPEWTDDEKEYFDMLDSDSNDAETDKSKGSISQKSYTGGYSSSYSAASSMSKKNEEEEIKEKERTDGYVSVQIIYTIEHANFTTVTINKVNGKISVDSPNETTVVIDSNNNYDITLDNVTSAKFNGESLHIEYEACPECRAFTTCNIKVQAEDISSVTNINQNWLKMKDSFSKRIVVNEEGSINIADEPRSSEVFHNEDNVNPEETTEYVEIVEEKTDGKSESSVVSHGKCRETYLAKTIRFFVLRRELTCAELVHRSLLDQYKRTCRWQPWCSISQYDTFADHRSLLSVLTPVHLTETEKWLMDSKLSDKPKYLSYKDLKKDSGKGFYHWMRPYERFEPKPMKPDNVLPPRQPRAFILRILEQQWKESEREELKGAKELLKAILKYRLVMDADCQTILNLPILDPRPEDERQIDDIIQALAHRIYEDLRMRLADDVQTRAKATITTKPPLPSEDMTIEEEQEEEAGLEVEWLKGLEEERQSSLQKVEVAEEMSPILARYWRRRNEEKKEEQFYQYLLREGSVPPYFRNVLGGAIWWEMNNAAGEAVTNAERRKMKCVCAAEEGTSRTDDTVEPYM